MHDAQDEAELLSDAHRVRAVDLRLDANLTQELVEVVGALLQAEGERVVLGDDERAREVAILQVLMQRIVGIVEAAVERLRQLTHVSGRHLAW